VLRKGEMHRAALHPQYFPLNRDFVINANNSLNAGSVEQAAAGIRQLIPGMRPAKQQRILEWMELFQHVLLEMMASILVIYSSVFIPESETDYLKQYVGSITIFAILMTLKDALYFFPDCTPMTTIVLWSATVYTDENKKTDWGDVLSRLTGQLAGYGVVFFLATANKEAILEKSLIATANNSTLYDGLETVHAVNEGLGTMIECICVAFASIPLMGKYNKVPLTSQNADDSVVMSKLEAVPPSDKQVFYFALSLSVIHYAIEQLFKTTMNPFITILQYVLRDDYTFALPVGLQFTGLVLACLYVYMYRPTQSTLAKLSHYK